MKDRYLFRGKRVDNGEWVVGQYVNTCYPGKDKETGHFIVVYPNEYHEIYTSTICQCTGLKDKNGKLIWENDVVRIVYNGIEHIYKVIWDVSELDFKATNGKENYKSNFQYLPCCEEIEVIGSAIDNPELLEVQE